MREEDELVATLAPLLARPWILVGVGTEDAFGPRLARRLQEAGAPALEAPSAKGVIVEEILGRDPAVVLLVEAGKVGTTPGAIRVVEVAPGEHAPVPSTSADLAAALRAKAPSLDVRVVAVEMAEPGGETPRDPAVGRAEDRLAGILWPGPVT